MKVDFTVNGLRKGHIGIDALVGDTRQRVLVDGMEVELVTVDTGKSLTLPFYGSSMEEAEKVFQSGKIVSFTVEGYDDA